MSACLWECYNECFRLTCQVSLGDLLFPVCMYMCMCAYIRYSMDQRMGTLSMTCGDVIHCLFISILFVRVHHCRCQLTCRRPSVRSFVRSYSNLVCLVIWCYSKSIRSEDLTTWHDENGDSTICVNHVQCGGHHLIRQWQSTASDWELPIWSLVSVLM